VGESNAADHGDGLGAAIGLEYLDFDERSVRGRLPVTDAIRQPYGVVHGGAYSVVAEGLCSYATGVAVVGEGMVAMGQANQATFIRPVSDGVIHADATVRHRGRTTWIWDCEFTDDQGKLCAMVRMTVAVRPRDGS
jgi:uncharacterized protein (TIGR00369 family)